MIRHALMTARRAAQRAFTLVEVMLAAVIIALGVLGLTALFAGAAKTQVDTARLTRASQAIERAADAARARFVSVGKGRLNPQSTFTIDQYDPGITVPGVVTVWHPFAAFRDQNDPAYPSHALAVDPRVNPTTGSLQLFTLVETPEMVLYEDPLGEYGTPPGVMVKPANHAAANINLPTGAQRYQYDWRTVSVTGNPFWTTLGISRIREIPFARFEPGTLRVRFEIARQGPEADSLRVLSRRFVVITDAAFADDPDDANVPDEDNVPAPAGQADGVFSIDRSSWMLFDRGLDPRGGFQLPGATEPRARLIGFSVPVRANEWVERIVLEPALRRVDRLLTLEERVVRNADGTHTGVTALWRRTRDGGHQLGMVSYVAEPVSSGASTPFVPPESGPAPDRLWRRVRLTLSYDRGAQRFTLETNQTDRAFALATGQILLVAGEGSDPSGPPSDPGAESFVRVARTVIGATGRVIGYLDEPPQDRGYPLIWPNGYGAATSFAQTLPNTATVAVWALAPQVRSLTPDSRVWRIRPIEHRVVDVR